MNGKKLNGILIEEENFDARKDRILRLRIDLCNFGPNSWLALNFSILKRLLSHLK